MYVEGDVPYVANGNNNNNGFGGYGGWEGIIGLAIIAALFSGGFGGFGGNRGGFGGYGAGSEVLGYELGKVATTNDVASGFTTNTILGVQRDQSLAIQQGFADIQNTLCQGFSTTNVAIERGLGTTNFNMAEGFNGINRQISDCCCKLERGIDSINYNMATNTCNIITNQNANTQKIIDYLQNEKICSLQAENVALKGRISNDAQTAQIVGALAPKAPIPAYAVPNPNCCYSFCGNGQNTIL